MMYSKALLFQDTKTAKAIINSDSPREQKALGRTIKNFKESTWFLFREGIVYTANYEKFTQNEELKNHLLATKNTLLAEASPEDKIWGIGLSEDDPKVNDPAKWQGLNLLGEALTKVRAAIYWEEHQNRP